MTNRILVDGVWVDPFTVDELHERIRRVVESGSRARILSVNVHGLNLAADDPVLKRVFNTAEMVFCDGAGVMLAARLGGHKIPERITYADWMWQFARMSEDEGLRWYLLGGRPGIAQEASSRLRHRFPKLQIVGTRHGYFDKAPESAECQAVLAEIKSSGAQVLIVGFGMPIQELWLDSVWSQLTVNAAFTGGAVFDYLSGNLRRPPWVLRAIGSEWLGRLLIEPRRLFHRYVVGNPRFLVRVLRDTLLRRLDSRGAK